jgi:hypothetical protein
MMPLNRKALAALAVAPAILFIACENKTSQEAADLTRKVAEADKLNQEAQKAAADQAKQLGEAGVKGVNPETMQLSDDQRKLLEARVRKEQGTNTQALLQTILDRDKEIKGLNDRLAKVSSDLPKPWIAKGTDNHFAMAMRFLRSKGVSQGEAQRLISRVNLMEELQPGYQVYHFYNNGTYATSVSQGRAAISPGEFQRQAKAQLEGERDEAKASADKLQTEVASLTETKTKIEEEISGLRTEKTALLDQVSSLTTLSDQQKGKLNAVHYLVGDRKKLEKDGVVIIPVFAKDRMGPKALHARFDKDLPLDAGANPEVVIRADEAGVDSIKKVHVVPGSLIKDQHYTVAYSDDRKTATVKILDPERLRNDRVVFAVN